MAPVPALGLERNAVRLVAYHIRWQALFDAEAGRLRAGLDFTLLAIEHIGSTAVPGLMAKPIMDIMLGVASIEPAQPLIEALGQLAYSHGATDDIEGRLYFRRDDDTGLRTHQLSVCRHRGRFWDEHLRFRDALRSDPALAAEYERLKHELARRFPHDRIAYSKAKDNFVARVLHEG